MKSNIKYISNNKQFLYLKQLLNKSLIENRKFMT